MMKALGRISWTAFALAAAVLGAAALGAWHVGCQRHIVGHDEAHLLYTCPMHPQIISEKPGTCPICGMTLVPVKETAPKPQAGPQEGHEEKALGRGVPGRTAIHVTSFERQVLDLAFAKVARKALVREIRTVATVAFDPMLATAQREYLEARKLGDKTLAVAAADRLTLMGMSRAQIQGLAKSGVQKNLYLPSEKGKVWIYTMIYEPDIGRVAVGQDVTVVTPDAPQQTFAAKIVAIDPVVDAATRTLRVRSEVSDPAGVLKPNRYVDATLRIPLDEKLAIPASALLWSGVTNYAFVDHGDGTLEPRRITAGARAGDDVQILDGLAEGESVVASAHFLIDSESALKAAIQEFGGKSSGGSMQGMPNM